MSITLNLIEIIKKLQFVRTNICRKEALSIALLYQIYFKYKCRKKVSVRSQRYSTAN